MTDLAVTLERALTSILSDQRLADRLTSYGTGGEYFRLEDIGALSDNALDDEQQGVYLEFSDEYHPGRRVTFHLVIQRGEPTLTPAPQLSPVLLAVA